MVNDTYAHCRWALSFCRDMEDFLDNFSNFEIAPILRLQLEGLKLSLELPFTSTNYIRGFLCIGATYIRSLGVDGGPLVQEAIEMGLSETYLESNYDTRVRYSQIFKDLVTAYQQQG